MESSTQEKVELPANFEDVPVDALVQLIADMLNRLMAHNDQIPLLPESLTRFHSRSPPSISILEYLKRILKFTNVEKTCLLITLHYIDLICTRNPLFTLSSLTCHRFVIAAITASSKGLCDTFCTNSLYAKVGGISVTELNILEREFLAGIDWRLTCTRDLLQDYYVNLVRTNTTSQFFIANSDYSSPASRLSDNDVHMTSRPPSPSGTVRSRRRQSVRDTSTFLGEAPITNDSIHRRPTVEQNMAFAALRESQDLSGRGGRQL